MELPLSEAEGSGGGGHGHGHAGGELIISGEGNCLIYIKKNSIVNVYLKI